MFGYETLYLEMFMLIHCIFFGVINLFQLTVSFFRGYIKRTFSSKTYMYKNKLQ